MARKLFQAILAVSVLHILSCRSDTVGPREKYITGTVRDTSGHPVPNAYLNFFYLVALHSFDKPTMTLPTTIIQFNTPHRGVLRVSIANYQHTVVRTFLPDTVQPGYNEVAWDFKDDQGRSLYSDVYFATGTLDDSLLKVQRLFAVVEQHLETNPSPFATTDLTGKFSIPLSRLPLNETFIRYNPDNGDSLGVYTIGPKDLLYAFTSSRFGVDTVEYSNLRDLTITLSQSK